MALASDDDAPRVGSRAMATTSDDDPLWRQPLMTILGRAPMVIASDGVPVAGAPMA
jgi:hypothetical protein